MRVNQNCKVKKVVRKSKQPSAFNLKKAEQFSSSVQLLRNLNWLLDGHCESKDEKVIEKFRSEVYKNTLMVVNNE
jgi:hypothetical protein